jgi:hypothetical protein
MGRAGEKTKRGKQWRAVCYKQVTTNETQAFPATGQLHLAGAFPRPKNACEKWALLRHIKSLDTSIMPALVKPWMRRTRGMKRFWAVVCLLLFLAVEVLASSIVLHKIIHPDADLPLHHCVVTLLAQGQLTSGTVAAEMVLMAVVVVFLRLPPLKTVANVAVDCRLSPSRAPPGV